MCWLISTSEWKQELMSTTSGIGSIKPYQKESNSYHLDSFTQKREKTVLICVLMCLQQQLLCYLKGEQEQFLIFTMGAPGKKKIVRILYKKKKPPTIQTTNYIWKTDLNRRTVLHSALAENQAWVHVYGMPSPAVCSDISFKSLSVKMWTSQGWREPESCSLPWTLPPPWAGHSPGS